MTATGADANLRRAIKEWLPVWRKEWESAAEGDEGAAASTEGEKGNQGAAASNQGAAASNQGAAASNQGAAASAEGATSQAGGEGWVSEVDDPAALEIHGLGLLGSRVVRSFPHPEGRGSGTSRVLGRVCAFLPKDAAENEEGLYKVVHADGDWCVTPLHGGCLCCLAA